MKCCPTDSVMKIEWEKDLRTGLEMPDIEIDRLSRLFKTLGHPLRLKIALLLLERDHCVCELVYLLGERQNPASHHLAIMKTNRVVESYNSSKWKYYKLDGDLVELLKDMIL
ncbi:MAG: metalloregulator ArsR/SmtB family transcription factor [Methanosarcinaceae archaeon]|nr:metalloregulator ArsR/SmtB family transcription factor [Methanosarcinaceae archaeon]